MLRDAVTGARVPQVVRTNMSVYDRSRSGWGVGNLGGRSTVGYAFPLCGYGAAARRARRECAAIRQGQGVREA